jgi:phosphatidylethanolamine/phosphatidyl-N-methylethanolamine N-methyltransferase
MKRPRKKLELFQFVKEYFAAPKAVGGFAPSSRELAELVTESASIRTADSVIEFGPGTGVFTKAILRKIRKDTKFGAIEIREDFVKLLQEKFPNTCIFHDSATNVAQCLQKMGLEQCDCIVSGLPFALFEPKLQDELLDAAVSALRPGGAFVTFTYFYSPSLPAGRKFKRKLNERFSRVEKTPIVWLNVFPAFAYKAVK